MGAQLLFLIVGTLSCITLMKLIMFVTRGQWKQKFNEVSLSFILAFLCGFILTWIPTLAMAFQQSIPFTTYSFLLFGKTILIFTAFFFLTFLAMSFIGNKKLKADPLQQKNVQMHLFLSLAISLFLLFYTYILTNFYTHTLMLNKENIVSSLLLMVGTIYTATRIFEHIHIEEVFIRRTKSSLSTHALFGLIGIALCSVLYSFIERLFTESSFLMTTVEWTSVLTLFTITITYIEHQFTHQQDQLQRKHVELQEQEQKYRSLHDYNPDAIFHLDMEGRFTAFNHYAYELTGFPHKELIQLSIPDLIVPEEAKRVVHFYERVKTGETANFESTLLTKKGERRYILVTGIPIKVQRRVTGVYGIVKDVTEERMAQEKINFLAYHDELTSLLNRRGMKKEIEKLTMDEKRPLATILIDIDLFKHINDHLGHMAGDELLQLVAERLKTIVRDEDLIARIGGDEFLLCFPEIEDRYMVRQTIENIHETMKEIFTIGDYYKDVTLSVGVSYFPEDGRDFDTLIKHADMAMYEVKRNGRNNYMEYAAAFEEKNVSEIVLLEELKAAIDKEAFHLHYQPKIHLNSGKIQGMEALIRWDHPEKGMISPGSFIPLAERSDLIIPLGLWVLQEACRQYVEWEKNHALDFHLSVNISTKQFLHPDFTQMVLHILKETGISPHNLDLEITETLAIENTEETIKKIKILRDIGVQITMDDFGTGYTSLSYLSMFALDRIKIDRSFISSLSSNRNHAVIVQSIIFVAKNLGITVIAEGVEDEDQVRILRDWNCEEAQGFYYSKPLPAEVLAGVLQKESILS
ncbi:putative bifunctional diguanylate cyclase/phosphodiesterase [Halobacillus faecis]